MAGTEAEVERARATLRYLIELSGMSQREVKKRLVERGSQTDLFRVLSGRLELKLRHILDIVEVLRLHPVEFFRVAFREPEQRSPFLKRFEDLIGIGRSQVEGRALKADPSRDELADLRQQVADLKDELDLLKDATGWESKPRPGGRRSG